MSEIDSAASDELLVRRPLWGALINGQWVLPEGAPTFEVLEAATGRPMARVVEADAALVDAAVTSSRRAYEEVWRHTPGKERTALMREVAERIRAHADELAELVAREMGKPRRDARRVDVVSSHTSFDYYAGLTESVPGEIIDQGAIEARVVYEPYGVVAAILPFNWPPIHFSKKGAPALAVGNTVVMKPGEQAPLTVLRLAEIANEVLPPGVLNAVAGLGAGPALVAHPRVERVTFTGATATGRKVMASAAANLTFVTLELGGKNALVVMEDADLDQAVTIAIEGMFYNQGAACTSTSRLLVHDSLYDAFAERFVAATAQLRLAHSLDPACDIGPMVDAVQRDRVAAFVEGALAQGATLLYRGQLPGDPDLAGGFWIAPAVFGDVTPAMDLFQEEVFGPVAALTRFSTEEEAVALVNESRYGLTAALVTADEARAWRLAERLEVGMVFVNNYTRRNFVGSPFGGVKESGYGREYGADTLHEFVRAKNVRFASGRGSIPTWPPR